jgi:hypothetical protein
MLERETRWEMLQRHVEEGRNRVAEQERLVVQVGAGSSSTQQVKSRLATLQENQRLREAHLAHLEAQYGPNGPPGW